jgi:hypothetical protein
VASTNKLPLDGSLAEIITRVDADLGFIPQRMFIRERVICDRSHDPGLDSPMQLSISKSVFCSGSVIIMPTSLFCFFSRDAVHNSFEPGSPQIAIHLF